MINTPDRKIYTVEDPIERQIAGLIQTEMKDGIGLTFSRALRSLVRADPDVIMVGEVRDLETAKMAADAAVTGHLVFTTRARQRRRRHHLPSHRDGPAALRGGGRLPLRRRPAAGAAALHCTAVNQETHHRRTLGAARPRQATVRADGRVRAGRLRPLLRHRATWGASACSKCMPVDDAMRETITGGGTAADIRAAAAEARVERIRDDGIHKVLAGTTSYLELLRVTS